MLSWFSHKPDRGSKSDHFRRSTDSAKQPPANAEASEGDKPPGRRSVLGISTPHDSVLAELHGLSPKTDSSVTSDTPQGLDSTRFASPTSASSHQQPQTSLSNPTNTTDVKANALNTIYDPFDGSVFGNLVSPNRYIVPEAHVTLTEAASKNEELWSHLSRILELQSQIATMHGEMEGIGTKQGDGKGKGKSSRSRAPSTSRPIGDEAEEAVGVERDEEAEKNRAREEEFAKLTEQFQGRKESINEIMSKLDDLSKAVTEFHTLQAPKLGSTMSSRNNSMGAKFGGLKGMEFCDSFRKIIEL